MKTFADLKEGDTIYAIYPKYYKNGSFWRWDIGAFKITQWYWWIPYSDGNARLAIKLDNGFCFNPVSNQVFHDGIDKGDEGTGTLSAMNVIYLININNIKLIHDYEYIVKDIPKTLLKKYKIKL